jgi:transketolase
VLVKRKRRLPISMPPEDPAMTSPATISRPYFETLRDYGAAHPEVVCLMGDLTKSCEAEGFEAAFPDRHFNFGMAEQNLIGAAGGMAAEGLLPVVHTFGVFITRRAFDQVQMALGVPGRRVRLMGFLPGITTPGGVTHQAIDDIGIMSGVPGMSIVEPGDATEIRSVLEAVHDVRGPVYCRMVRGDVPVLFEDGLTFGKARHIAKGRDLCILSGSIATQEAIRATATLEAAGISVSHLHISTYRPFNDPSVLDAISQSRAVLTVENHLVDGGLGSATAMLMAESGLGKKLKRLGIQHRYGGAGSTPYLMKQLGFDADAIIEAGAALMGTAIIRDADGAFTTGDGDLARQEAL